MRSSDSVIASTKVSCLPCCISNRGCTPFNASATMNSARSNPTPSTSSAATVSAFSATARLT